MNKKGFTLIELLAVLVILSVVTMIAAPNIMKTQDSSKRKLYVIDAKTFVTAASYMYAQNKYLNDENYFVKNSENSYTISLDKLDNVTINKDPYDYPYDLKNSIITFTEPASDSGFEKRTITLSIRSCDLNDNTKCHCVSGSFEQLNEDLVDASCKE